MSLTLPMRRLVSQEDSAMIPRPDVPRSTFSGSWSRKTTFDAGFLVPFLVDEILPGDTMKYDVSAYVRMATPLFPLMDSMRVDTFFFFVPARILWDNWRRFMGEQSNPGDTINYTVPVVNSNAGGFAAHSLFDHFGLPTVGQVDAAGVITVNALPLRAYNRIWNEWFRDQNSLNSESQVTSDGPDSIAAYPIKRRAKSHDYFTSALPWPQKFTAPTVPLAGLAPLVGLGATAASVIGNVNVTETNGGAATYTRTFQTNAAGLYVRGTAGNAPDVYANLAAATGVDVNLFRQAFLVQQLLERDARGGTRYTEIVRSHFGVNSPDARLQRPEYIGGGSSPINVVPVAQTAPGASSVVGQLGGAATSVGEHRATLAAQEHGYVIGLINVKSELSYQQGLHKLWSRRTRQEFYFPSLAGLGEQAILRQEIYARGIVGEDTTVFGYQERWHEYRTHVSEVTGAFKSTTATPIDQWHLAQRFTAPPVLGTTFLQEDPPMSRVLATGASTNQQFLADILIRRSATRPIPAFGTPVLLGRF